MRKGSWNPRRFGMDVAAKVVRLNRQTHQHVVTYGPRLFPFVSRLSGPMEQTLSDSLTLMVTSFIQTRKHCIVRTHLLLGRNQARHGLSGPVQTLVGRWDIRGRNDWVKSRSNGRNDPQGRWTRRMGK